MARIPPRISKKGGAAYCFASKGMPVFGDLMKLNKGDKVRFIGYADNIGGSFGDDEYQPWFQILRVELIESKAEQDAQDTNSAYR